MATFQRRFRRKPVTPETAIALSGLQCLKRPTRPVSMSRSAHERHRRVLVHMVPQASSLTPEAKETLRKELKREYGRATGELRMTLGRALDRLGT